MWQQFAAMLEALFFQRTTLFAGLLVTGGVACTAPLLGYAVFLGSLAPLRAAWVFLLVVFVSISFLLFVRGMESEDRLSIESNWGGLGGGLGGWRVSSSVTFLLTTAALFTLLVGAFATPGTDLYERYRAALNLAHQKGIQFENRSIAGNKLYLKGVAPSQADVNAFWDQVKLANPDHDDIQVDLTIPSQRSAQAESAPAKK